MRVTVLGATGGIGRAIVRELHARGHDVAAVSRTIDAAHVPGGVAVRRTDLTDRAATRAACADADVVVMAANLPYRQWASQLGPLTDSALDAAVAADARFVMVDNLYASTVCCGWPGSSTHSSGRHARSSSSSTDRTSPVPTTSRPPSGRSR